MTVKNKVQLITYPDSLGGDLKHLSSILETFFPDVFEGGIHILPPFPSSGDRGFAPITYFEIEPQFGTWNDIQRLSTKYDILLDLMINHISARSEYFQDFLKNGARSKYADLFIPIDKIWTTGEPEKSDLEKIFLRRDLPFSEFQIESTGKSVRVWTTFGKTDPSEQIDLDINSDATRKLIEEIFQNFSDNNVHIVRLDALGYLIKKPDTSCFFVEPEIFKVLDWITEVAKKRNIELLPEIHSHYSIQYNLSDHGYWIYDFILPYLVLEALVSRQSTNLHSYLSNRPYNQFTMLDCHDGIPVKPDLNDLYDSVEVRKIIDTCLERGGNLSLIYSPEHKDEDGFDVHQIRGTYYTLLDCNDDAYLAARAIQFFVPGIPQVYYVGLLAGKNDFSDYRESGDGRIINRHNYTIDEIETRTNDKVVQRLIKLIKFRNTHPAFNGEFSYDVVDSQTIFFKWMKDDSFCTLHINLRSYRSVIHYSDRKGNIKEYLI